MKMILPGVCSSLLVMAGPVSAAPSGCGLPAITGMAELDRSLELRAVEVVKRAASQDAGLATLVAPSASFSLGGGDVARPLGTGVDGARELARTMHADSYRFLGWDYMDTPADPCANHQVTVEFIDNHGKTVSQVEFTFEAGRVVAAAGWQRSFETGRL